MDCRFCKVPLSTGMEIKCGACVGCVGRELASCEEANARVLELTERVRTLDGQIFQFKQASAELERIRDAEKIGREARVRGATIEDNPFDPDDDEAAAWSFGWLSTHMFEQHRGFAGLLLWTADQLSIVREVAAGGASGDEVASKLLVLIQEIKSHFPDSEDAEEKDAPK